MSWSRKHLLDLESLSREEIETILNLARNFKMVGERRVKKVPSLTGKTVVNLFIEPSTRTRISFELAAKRLAADVVNFSAESSSLRKGETLKDTAQTLEALNADVIIIRHSASGAAQFLTRCVNASVINAGDGAHEHPTQALLDAFTIIDKIGSLEGKKVSIIGDIAYSRVARSNIWALTKLGASVTLCGPPTLLPSHFTRLGCRLTHNLDEAIEGADVLNLLRIQHERQLRTTFPGIGEYRTLFGITQKKLEKARPDLLIMHPGPINRGVEIDAVTADGPRSVIKEQVTNGIAIRMATLFLVVAASSGQSTHIDDFTTFSSTHKTGPA